MMHTIHENLPGYDPEQIWHDGCDECEHRGDNLPYSLGNLDISRFRRAWDRAAEYETGAAYYRPLNVSRAEGDLLRMLYLVRRSLEISGYEVHDTSEPTMAVLGQ